MHKNHINRFAALALLAVSLLTASAAQAKAIITMPRDAVATVAMGTYAANSKASSRTVTVTPSVNMEKIPVSAKAKFMPTLGGDRGTIQLASWIDDVKNWLRNVVADAAYRLRGGARSTREWGQRIVDWSRNHLGGSGGVNAGANGSCDAYVIPAAPVFAICHLQANGGFSVEVHTK